MLNSAMRAQQTPMTTPSTRNDGSRFDPVNRKRVELNEDLEFQYWTHRFGCTADQLLEALAIVGVNARAVAEYVGAVRSALACR